MKNTHKAIQPALFEKILKGILNTDRKIVLLDNNTPKDVTEDMVIAVDEGSKFGFYKPKKTMNGITTINSTDYVKITLTPVNTPDVVKNAIEDYMRDNIDTIITKWISNPANVKVINRLNELIVSGAYGNSEYDEEVYSGGDI